MRLTLLLPFLLIACSAAPPVSDHFVGQVQGCGGTTRGVLELRAGQFVFAPDEGVLAIHGTVDASGAMHGEAALNGTAGNGAAANVHIAFDGQRVADAVTGTLTRPGCAQAVALARPDRTMLPGAVPPAAVRSLLPW